MLFKLLFNPEHCSNYSITFFYIITFVCNWWVFPKPVTFTKCDGVSVCVVVSLGVGGGSGGNVSSVQVALDISQPQLTWEVDGCGYHEDVII